MDKILTKIKPLKFLIIIVEMNKAEKVSSILNEHGFQFQFVSIAEGTAPSEIRSYWGFGETEKSIIWSIIPGDTAEYVLSILKTEFSFNKPNTGVAFVLPINSFVDPIIATHIGSCGDKPQNQPAKGEIKMEDRLFSLLMAIVKKGYSDEVMEAAREAGAQGGTIIKARGTGEHEIAKFMGMMIEPEKDIIIILAKKGSRTAIMKSIYDKAGLHTEGNGLILSLPVEEVLGAFSLNSELAEEALSDDNPSS